jgi:hypothetical protein
VTGHKYFIATPVTINKNVTGVVCFVFYALKRSQLQQYIEKVESACSWLSCLSQMSVNATSQHAETILKSTAISLSHASSSEAAMALTTELARRMQCQRVTIGFVDKSDIHVVALSDSVNHDAKQNLIKSIRSAMQEAVDQQETLGLPAEESNYYSLRQHEQLSAKYGSQSICTVPLILNDMVIGAIMFERQGKDRNFDAQEKELCEQLASLIAPVLYYRRLNDRPALQKLVEAGKGQLADVFGTSRPGRMLGSLLLISALIFTYFKQWDYRVAADAALEGKIERVITSPEKGFIKTADARPGDIVDSGALLASLDDRDLQLEKLNWQSKHEQISKEYREALALHDLSRIGILRAQLTQAEAQLEILEQKLQRSVISVPISGVIVSGDLTRSLGSPVERGQVLYTVSPLEDYRVVLHVNESDIADISAGLKGELVLSAAAEDKYPFEVTQITPVSIAENGINYFRVEASLVERDDMLRPGMQGIGKIKIGERRLLWIWTHKMLDWARLKMWSWW